MVEYDIVIYPWHNRIWRQLQDARNRGRLAHAYILRGESGYGRDEFARAWVGSLLCAQPDDQGSACGRCAPCAWYQSDNHPDVLFVQPTGASHTIGIDAVREANEFMTVSAQSGSSRIVVFYDADRLNAHSSNSLLKTLEEPPGRALLLLLSRSAEALLPTIRSRCQVVDAGHCDHALASQWLATQLDNNWDSELLLGLAQGAPLLALAMTQENQFALRQQTFIEYQELCRGARDAVTTAAAWLDRDITVILHWLRSWYVDMIRLASVPSAAARNVDLYPKLIEGIQRRSLAQLFADYDAINATLRLQRTSVNMALTIEALLLTFTYR